MNREGAIKATRQGVIAAVFYLTSDIILAIIGYLGNYSEGTLGDYNLDYNEPITFLLIVIGIAIGLLLAFGVYKRSRVATIALVVLVIYDAATYIEEPIWWVSTTMTIFSLIILWFFVKAAQGAIVFHRIEKVENPNYKKTSKIIEEQTILNIVNGDASEVLIADYKSKNAIISLVATPLLVLVQIVLLELTNLSFFWAIYLLIPIIVGYGLYLMFTNQAVFYASRTDLLYNFALFGVPLFGSMIGLLFENAIIMGILLGVSVLGSLHFFAMKSATANVSLNSDLNIYQLISVMCAKTFVVLFFLLALNRQKEVYKKNKRSGRKGFAVLGIFGALFYKVSINAEKVFEKRGTI